MIYLDNASTKPLSDSTKQYIRELLESYGNPSSLYELGQKNKRIIEDIRKKVGYFINADLKKSDIIFTSSGSASNTLAIRGFYQANYNSVILFSSVCHKSLYLCAKSYDNNHMIPADSQGLLNLDYLENKIKEYRNRKILVVISAADSEIGTIQYVNKIDELCAKYGAYLYIDYTGFIPYYPVNIKKFKSTVMIGFSGHKLGALKGIGILYKPKNVKIEPLIYGKQEFGLCAGTENFIGIASLDKIETFKYDQTIYKKRDYLWNQIETQIPDCYLLGPSIYSKNRIPGNLYIMFKGVNAEGLLILLDMVDIQISTGSACSSRDSEISPTLKAINISKKDANSCIRISLSGTETKEELDYVVQQMKQSIKKLRNFQKTGD